MRPVFEQLNAKTSRLRQSPLFGPLLCDQPIQRIPRGVRRSQPPRFSVDPKGAILLANYEPAWRRPIAGIFRKTAHAAVAWCVRRDVHPNTVSYSSIVAAAGAAVCFWQASAWPWLLILGAAFCYLRLWFNMLDGMVALASGKASRSGEIANELPDRISDVVIFVGVAHSGLCHPLSGYWVAIFALLVAYVGTLGQAVGVQREFSGLMTKPWRMVTLHIGAWITLGLLWSGRSVEFPELAGLSVLDVTHVLIVAGCVQTIWIRLVRIVAALRALPEKSKPAADSERTEA
jgi:phosphatidylglycerophosphate synthase